MEILHILQWISAAGGAISATTTVFGRLSSVLRDRSRQRKTSDILEFMQRLGLKTEADVREAVGNWTPPREFAEANKQELVLLLNNLVHGCRAHSTHGTPLSSYLRCERLIEQLLQNIQPRLKSGERVQDWKLKAFLGMGSFGEVWRAENPLYPDQRAYKFFTQEHAREWLVKEAVVLRSVQKHLKGCPNVIGYLDVTIDGSPYPYLALEYAEGGSLEDWLYKRPDDRIALNVVELMRGISRGMSDAHRHAIYHRDLKPANILFTGDAEPIPKVADFGLSSVGQSEANSSQRSEAVLVGTRMYHPPEASDPFGKRHPAQDDVFALGVIWYQVLTGDLVRPPYDFADRLKAHEVDSRTLKMISKCLAHPDTRYPSACELYDELDADAPPGPGEWAVPAGCFDVAGIAREYLLLRGR